MGLSSVFTHLDFTPYPWDPDLGVSIRAGANIHRRISPWSPHTNPRAHSTASPQHLLLLPGMTCRSFPDPHAPHLSPMRLGSAQSLFPALSPVRRGCPHAGTYPRSISSQRDVRAASPRGHHHSQSCLPVGAGHPHPSSPISPACPIWLLVPSDTDNSRFGSLRDVQSTSPTL